jgi:hypothetical protein
MDRMQVNKVANGCTGIRLTSVAGYEREVPQGGMTLEVVQKTYFLETEDGA